MTTAITSVKDFAVTYGKAEIEAHLIAAGMPADMRSAQLGRYVRLAGASDEAALAADFADKYRIDGMNVALSDARAVARQRAEYVASDFVQSQDPETRQYIRDGYAVAMAASDGEISAAERDAATRAILARAESEYATAHPEDYETAKTVYAAADAAYQAYKEGKITEEQKELALKLARDQADAYLKKAAPSQYATAKATYTAASQAYEAYKRGGLTEEQQQQLISAARTAADDYLTKASPEYYGKAKAAYETARKMYTEKVTLRRTVYTTAYTVCVAKGGTPETCQQAVEAILDFAEGKISQKELEARSGGIVGAVAAVAACSAVGLGAAAPLCAWVGSEIGKFLGPYVAEFNAWLKEGVLSYIPGFSESEKVVEAAWEAAKDAAKAVYDYFD